MSRLTIGELGARSGLAVRTVRFYADANVVPEAGRSEAGYRLFESDAVARLRLVRTLRELGVGLDDIRRVLAAEATLADVAAAHAAALDAQIRTLRLQRAVLGTVARTTDLQELEQMTDLTTMTAQERHRILEEYLEAVFGDAMTADPVPTKMRMGAPDLPDDPSPDQVAAWTELVALLRDPDFVAASRAMAEHGAPQPETESFAFGKAVFEHAGAAAREGVDPASPAALTIVEQLEALAPSGSQDRATVAERIDAFTDRRVGRYWALVAIVNGWPPAPDPIPAWEWFAAALRAHATSPGGTR